MNKKNIIKTILLILIITVSSVVIYFFVNDVPKTENPSFGIIFSQKHTTGLGLNWQVTYKSLLEDLGAKKLKLLTHWDLIEPEKGNFVFKDLDWQLVEAQKRGVEVILVIGMKTGRWPECHLPDWAYELSEEEQKERILRLIQVMTTRYREFPSVVAWSVENEPLFDFGVCPWTDKEFLKEEIALVKEIDHFYKKPIMITDSGEASLWFEAAELGDFVGVTMYRKIWMSDLNRYFNYPFPPFYYWKKQDLISQNFDKKVVCSELQAEPWGPNLLYDSPLEEQLKTMNIDIFKENIQFAKQTGLDSFYLWGSEWWYWMKEEQGQDQIWNEAKKLF